jgi:hypothetical protein
MRCGGVVSVPAEFILVEDKHLLVLQLSLLVYTTAIAGLVATIGLFFVILK